MNKNKKIIFITILLGAMFCLPVFFGYFKLTIAPALGQQDNYSQSPEISDLNKQIQDKKNQIKQIQDKQAQYTQTIQEKQAEKASLSNQLSILDNQTAKLELDIASTQTEIDRLNLEIKRTQALIQEKQAQIDKEKGQVAVALKLIYQQDRTSTLEILLLNNSLSDFLDQVKYLEDVNREIGDSVDALKQYKSQLDGEEAALVQNNKDAVASKNTLEENKQALGLEKMDKNYLLEQTNNSERQYQQLLAQAKQEQLQASSDITNIEKKVREKLSRLSVNKLVVDENGFIWPVPKNFISAYFHDPNYPFRYIFEHPAIDIRASQSTPVRAAASGYVAQAHNGGMGYNYIMIVHANGLATVYGHVSKILVANDEYVAQGQIIALSGGLPGTPGAGPLTTGSHLHFEVRLNGIPTDPLNYLP